MSSVLEIWCDGSSTGRAGREWGYGFVIAIDGEPVVCGYGGGAYGSNNTAEMEAAIQGITHYAKTVPSHPEWPLNAVLVSDSMYALSQATGRQQAHTNVEQANRLRMLYERYMTGWKHVRGHSGEHLNERCDWLSKKGKSLYARKNPSIIEEELTALQLETK